MPVRRIRELRQQLLDEAQRLAFRRSEAPTFAESDKLHRLGLALEEAAATLAEAIRDEAPEPDNDCP